MGGPRGGPASSSRTRQKAAAASAQPRQSSEAATDENYMGWIFQHQISVLYIKLEEKHNLQACNINFKNSIK